MTQRRNVVRKQRPKQTPSSASPRKQSNPLEFDRLELYLSVLSAFSQGIVNATNDEGILASVTAALAPNYADWVVAAFAQVDGEAPVASIRAANPLVAQRLAGDFARPDSTLSQLLVDVREQKEDSSVLELANTEQMCGDVSTTYLAAPIVVDRSVIGAIVLGIDDETPRYDIHDCRFVHDLARRVSIGIDWTRRRNASIAELRGHRRIETALRESEARFRTLANAGPVLIRQDDEQGMADYFNHPWLAFTGRTIPEQMGERWLESVHPNDVAAVKASIESALVAHEPLTIEYRMRRFDGEYCWMTDRGVPLHAVDGSFLGYIWSALDISDRKRAESGLRLLATTGVVITSSLDLREMLEQFALLVTEWFVNLCAIDLFENNDLRQVTMASSRPGEPESEQAAIQLFLRSLSRPVVDRANGDHEARAAQIFVTDKLEDVDLRRELESYDITSVIVARMESRGRLIGVMTFATRSVIDRVFDSEDLSLARTRSRRVAVAIENAQLFEAAQNAEHRYRRLFEGAADAIVAFDQSLEIREVNPALMRLVRRSRKRLINRPVGDLVVGQSEEWAAIFAALDIGEWRGEFRLETGDRSTAPVEAWVTRMSVDDGAIFIAAMRDVSERDSLEAARRQLLATVSHDLKNPINSIKANAQLAIRQLRRGNPIEREKMIDTFSRIDGLTNRMVLQIEDLMDVALLEAGTQLEFQLSDVDLVLLARLVVDQYQATTNRHRIIVQGSETASVIGQWDEHRIERVITNLLTNAIKYSPDGGDIVIDIGTETDAAGSAWARLAISDEGVGIPTGDLPHLFSRFGRGQNVLMRISGTGIGLVGVSQIIGQHGGTVEVSSQEGKGSTFTIRLPLAIDADTTWPTRLDRDT
jgi:PAS domain S-box-containing protein